MFSTSGNTGITNVYQVFSLPIEAYDLMISRLLCHSRAMCVCVCLLRNYDTGLGWQHNVIAVAVAAAAADDDDDTAAATAAVLLLLLTHGIPRSSMGSHKLQYKNLQLKRHRLKNDEKWPNLDNVFHIAYFPACSVNFTSFRPRYTWEIQAR